MLRKLTRMMIFCTLLYGCALPKVPLEHTLSVDRDGNVDLYENAASEDSSTASCDLFHNLQKQIDLISRSVGASDQERILIFIHGGLNLRSKSRERVLEQLPSISAVGAMEQDRYYPIFINWRSGPLSTYAEQTFQIRDGRKEPFWGPVTSQCC